MSYTRKLNNGCEIPIIGLGTYNLLPGQLEQVVQDAIDAGYRHFDCAWIYGNEPDIGHALHEKLQEGNVKREELFITSKLWCNFHQKDKVVPMIKETLANLRLDYIDLYLIHWPLGFKETANVWPPGNIDSYSDVDYLETWGGMEECVELGMTKSIGISNFNSEQITRLLENCNTKPAVNQIEVNPNINQKNLIKFCSDHNIIVTGYCPLGQVENEEQPGFPTPTLRDPKVIEMAPKYKKSPAQVILNYLVSLGITIIPKSANKSRIIENINIFDFQLEAEDTAYLNSCNTNQRICNFEEYKDHQYYPFNIEY